MTLAARIKAGWIEAPAEPEDTAEDPSAERRRMSARAGATDERADLHRDAGGAAARRADPLRARSRRRRRPGHPVPAAGPRRLRDRHGQSRGAGGEAPILLYGPEGQGRGFAALADEVDRLLEADCLQTLAMANKAGLAIAGFAKVAAALEVGQSGRWSKPRRRLRRPAKVGAEWRRGGGSGPRRIELFTSSQLDLALGRTNVIHAALAGGGLTEAFLARCERLALYRGDSAATFDEDEAERPRANARGVGDEPQFLPLGREDDLGSGTE